MILDLVLFGAPRTKKNNRVHTKSGAVLPSEAFMKWERLIMDQKHVVRHLFGDKIPIIGPVSVKALIYRDAARGDAAGYYQAIGDVLQSPMWQCTRPERLGKCGRRVRSMDTPQKCPHCDWTIMRMKHDGLGVILDDDLIENWNKSERRVDREHPRVELSVKVIQPKLFVDLGRSQMELLEHAIQPTN